MQFEIDLLGVYYFIWSLCMLFLVLGIVSVLSDFIIELRSVKSSLLDVHRGVCALDHTLKRVDQTTISAV